MGTGGRLARFHTYCSVCGWATSCLELIPFLSRSRRTRLRITRLWKRPTRSGRGRRLICLLWKNCSLACWQISWYPFISTLHVRVAARSEGLALHHSVNPLQLRCKRVLLLTRRLRALWERHCNLGNPAAFKEA